MIGSFWQRRRKVVIVVVLCLIGLALAAAWLVRNESDASDNDVPAIRAKPAVGQFGLEKDKDGATRYGMQREEGRVGLVTGSIRISDLPYGLPLYPRAKLLGSTKLEGVTDAETGIQVNFATPDPRDKVLAYYRGEIALARLDSYSDTRVGPVNILSAGYPGGRDGGFQLTVRTGEKGETLATLSTGFGQRYKPEPRMSIDDMLLLESNAARP